MFDFFANMFGYLLDFLYNLVNNYGVAIILFTIVIKLILLPISVKQQKTMKKSAKVSEKVKILQVKYKNNPEQMNKEIMELYKTEKMNPLSGCFTAIVQMLLILSIFYMVRSPITYMRKVSTEDVETYKSQLQEAGVEVNTAYPEIDLIREYEILKEKNPEDANVDKLNLDMNFLGLDLNKVPQQNLNDIKVYIIPILYILSSFISIRLTTAMQQRNKKNNKNLITDGSNQKIEEEVDTMAQTNKMMSWMMPLVSISIAFVAPLGLALYWLMNNLLMIIERLILNKVLKSEEE